VKFNRKLDKARKGEEKNVGKGITELSGPAKLLRIFPDSTSEMLIILSSPPEAILFPSEEKQIEWIISLWPMIC